MVSPIKIAVLGGGGRTGLYLVKQLLQQGFALKILLRNPAEFTLESPDLEIVVGDATDAAAIYALTEGCQTIISTIGQRPNEPLVASQATIHVLQAMQRYHIRRYILVAGLNVDTPSDKKSPATTAATEWMKATYPAIHADRQKAYALLTESTVDWTLVRVPLIHFTAATGNIKVDLKDCPGKSIHAGDIAVFLSEQLADSRFIRRAPFIANPDD
jgi:putative NADH-flavin reductase